jgi:hypothetical protein
MRKVTARTTGGIVTVTANQPDGPNQLLIINRAEVLELIGELAAEWLESAPADVDRPMAAALGDLLEALSEGILRRTAVQS